MDERRQRTCAADLISQALRWAENLELGKLLLQLNARYEVAVKEVRICKKLNIMAAAPLRKTGVNFRSLQSIANYNIMLHTHEQNVAHLGVQLCIRSSCVEALAYQKVNRRKPKVRRAGKVFGCRRADVIP